MEPILRDLTEDDIPALTQMWRESDQAWPGGFSGGVEFTEDFVREEERKADALSTRVVQLGNRIVGYCRVEQSPGTTEYAYVALLNVSPDCHGKGFGRLLMHRAVEDAIDAKLRMLDIGTWPANLKALPLYKKVGFYWQPETSVYMQNYVALIVHTPMARPFFERHDWYASLVRELNQEPDEFKWHGKKVYAYHWEADGQLLKAVIDKEARWITAFENDTFSVSAHVAMEEIPAGIEETIHWELENKTESPLAVTLLAEAEDPGIDLRYQKHLSLEGRVLLSAPFTVDPNVEDKHGSVSAHLIKTDLVVDGLPLTLRCGLKVRQPVSLGFEAEQAPLTRDVPVTALITIRNEQDEAYTGTVRFSPDPRVRLDHHEAEFSVEARSTASVPVTVTMLEDGAAELAVHAEIAREGGTVVTKPARFPLIAVPFGGVLGHVGESEARLENQDLGIVIPLHPSHGTGAWWIVDRHSGSRMFRVGNGRLGPPFPPPYLGHREFGARLEYGPGTATCILSTSDPRYPGLIVEKRITMGANAVVRVEERLRNASPNSHDLQFKVGVRSEAWNLERGITPLKGGLAVGTIDTEMLTWQDFPREPEAYAEGWQAHETQDCATGILWTEADSLDLHWAGGELTLQAPALAPGECASLTPYYVYAGPGTWRTVRRWWQKLVQGGLNRHDPGLQTRPLVQVETMPSPLVVTGSEATLVIQVDDLRDHALQADLRLVPPDGWQTAEARWEVRDTKLGTPFTARTPVNAPAGRQPGVYTFDATLATEMADYDHPLPVIVLGDESDVTVDEADGLVSVDNGRLKLQVAPDFFGGLVSLKFDGEEQLFTGYPERGCFGWQFPWFGGLHPYIHWNPGLLHKETFKHKLKECTGAQGVAWRGLTVVCSPQHRSLRGLRLETTYLTTGGSSVVAVVNRYINLAPIPREFEADLVAFPQPGGNRDSTRGVVLRDGARHSKRVTAHSRDLRGDAWAALLNSGTGDAAVLVTSAPCTVARVMDQGLDDRGLSTETRVHLPPGEALETLTFLVLAQGLESAQAYTALRGLKGLP